MRYQIENVTPSPKIIRPNDPGAGPPVILPSGATTTAEAAEVTAYSRDVLTLTANGKIKVRPIRE